MELPKVPVGNVLHILVPHVTAVLKEGFFFTVSTVGTKEYDGNFKYNIIECELDFSLRFPECVITEYCSRNVINLVDKFRVTRCNGKEENCKPTNEGDSRCCKRCS